MMRACIRESPVIELNRGYLTKEKLGIASSLTVSRFDAHPAELMSQPCEFHRRQASKSSVSSPRDSLRSVRHTCRFHFHVPLVPSSYDPLPGSALWFSSSVQGRQRDWSLESLNTLRASAQVIIIETRYRHRATLMASEPRSSSRFEPRETKRRGACIRGYFQLLGKLLAFFYVRVDPAKSRQ
jgi:hypothetical protein